MQDRTNEDFFGKIGIGRPRYGKTYHIFMKKNTFDAVSEECMAEGVQLEYHIEEEYVNGDKGHDMDGTDGRIFLNSGRGEVEQVKCKSMTFVIGMNPAA